MSNQALALEPIQSKPYTEQHERCKRFEKRGSLLFSKFNLKRTRYQWLHPVAYDAPLGYINPETREWNFMDPITGKTFVTRNGNTYRTTFHLGVVKHIPAPLPESIAKYMELRPIKYT